MRINIANEANLEIETIMETIMKKYPDSHQEDIAYVEMNTGIKEIDKVGMVLYPKLLTYGYGVKESTIPWICVRIEIENGPSEESIRELLRWLVSRFKNIGYSPFMDEDATGQHFTKEDREGWTRYSMFINPDYPEGVWENHTL